MVRHALTSLLALLLVVGVAAPGGAVEVDLVGTWYVLMHYKDDGSPNPDAERWDERVWVFEKKGSRMRWSVYPIVVFHDESGRFERTAVQYSRVLHYWEPDAGQLADIGDGLQVHSRGAKKKTLRGSDLDGWSSSRSRGAASASVVTYSELWTIEGMPTQPVFSRADVMGGGRTDTMEGLTTWSTSEVRERGSRLVGTYQRDGRRHGTFRMMRSGEVGDVQGARTQAELQRSAYRRTLEQSLDANPETRALIVKQIEEAIAETGVGVALTDAEMDELITLSVGLDVELPQQEIERRIDEVARRMLTKGATPGARHDDGARYRWPFGGDTSRELIDGSWADPGVRPRSALTFRLPVGTPVVAARDGVVTRVVDGHTQGGLQRSFLPKSNTVMIAHRDGTMGYYAHMKPGIRVAEGQQVRAGDALAESGETGYVEQPQLLFVVFRFTEDLEPRSVDIRFDDGSPAGVTPVVGRSYGGPPAQ